MFRRRGRNVLDRTAWLIRPKQEESRRVGGKAAEAEGDRGAGAGGAGVRLGKA